MLMPLQVSRPTCKDGAKVRLIDSHRADAISAELYGMRHLRMSELRAALIAMDFTKLEVWNSILSRTVVHALWLSIGRLRFSCPGRRQKVSVRADSRPACVDVCVWLCLQKEDLLSVWRTLPNSSERGHVNNYLKGEHPKYMVGLARAHLLYLIGSTPVCCVPELERGYGLVYAPS